MRLVAREGGRWGIYVRGFQALTVVRLGMMLLVVYVPAMNSMTGDFAQGATFFIGLASAAESFCANVAYLGVNIDSLRRKIVEIGRESAKKDERERLKDAMALMDRQRTAGIMSAAISHELKQPLTWALTNTQLAMRLLVNGQPGPVQQLVKIEDALRRAGRIIDGLQSFMRPDAAAPRLLDIRLAVESAVQLLAPKLKKDKVQLVVELGSHPLLAVADNIQLCQVFVNVLRNAIQACQDQPIRKVSVTAEEVGGKLRVRIQDTGVGFPEQVITAIGLPFSTQNAEGLGLGLAVCQNIMASFGGSLLLHNASAGGAVVEIELLT
jgi:two-component system C4-dicarboxylate transport sensor histidine kinase DctB